jgi:hypothetical protein
MLDLRPMNLAERAQMRVWSKSVDEYFCGQSFTDAFGG